MTSISCCWLWAAVVGANEPQLVRYEQLQLHMATEFRVVLYAADEMTANRGLAAAFARIAELDARMNDYKEESELSRLSSSAPHPRGVPVSPDLWNILERSQEFSQLSDGAFDVTVGPLTKLWRRSRRQGRLPPPEQLRAARAAVGYRQLVLDAERQTARLLLPEMRLDLGGIAQGYAADEALRVLRSQGITRALVNASGDIVAGDPPPGEPGWKVGVAPLAEGEPPSLFLPLANRAVSTSGDAFQFVEIDGVRYSHIVDPQTGLGLTHRSSVTVLAPDGTAADALATAVSVLPPAQGLALAERLEGVEALIVRVGQEPLSTSGFPGK